MLVNDFLLVVSDDRCYGCYDDSFHYARGVEEIAEANEKVNKKTSTFFS